jgi:hypothetical protein
MHVLFAVFCVLLVCKCVLYYCHRQSTQLHLNICIISIQLAKEAPEFKKSQWIRQADETPNSFYSALRIVLLRECRSSGSKTSFRSDSGQFRSRVNLKCYIHPRARAHTTPHTHPHTQRKHSLARHNSYVLLKNKRLPKVYSYINKYNNYSFSLLIYVW